MGDMVMYVVGGGGGGDGNFNITLNYAGCMDDGWMDGWIGYRQLITGG